MATGDQRAPTTQEVLIAARELIDTPDKWIQHSNQRDNCFCAVGAIASILRRSKTGFTFKPFDMAHNAVVKQTGQSKWCLHEWNDRPERTHAEVLAAFDAAIAALRSPVVTHPSMTRGMVP